MVTFFCFVQLQTTTDNSGLLTVEEKSKNQSEIQGPSDLVCKLQVINPFESKMNDQK